MDRLKGRSFAAFFYRISGQMEDRLTKEEEEAYAAALKYDTAAVELKSVEQDIDSCRRRLAELRWCGNRYQRALDAKKEAIRRFGRPEVSDLIQLEEQEHWTLKASKKRWKKRSVQECAPVISPNSFWANWKAQKTGARGI